jgi:chloride channel 7
MTGSEKYEEQPNHGHKHANDDAQGDKKDDGASHKFQEKVEFSKAEQFGSRAVGGHAPTDAKLYGTIQSSDYLIPDTKQEEAYQRSFTPTMRNRRRLFIWMLYAWIGLAVALVILAILGLCGIIEKQRVKATKKELLKDDLMMAWVVWTGSSLVLCLLACLCVLWQPAAASSGIPALIAYLNGVLPLGGKSTLTGKATGFRSGKTLAAKSIGMILSIPSGLCLGPEGPIIHISALLGHHITRLVQTASHSLLPERFQFTVKPGEGRDFLATGAACGICVAFRAPLAGCLFVVEEAASFYTTEHLEYTFFATVISYFVAWFLANPDDGFTKFKQPTGFFCTVFDGYDVALFVVVAIAGGVLGALFNQIVEHLNHLRAHHVNKSLVKRVTEVVLLVLVTGTITVFLPAMYKCQHPTRSLLMEDSIGCLSPEDSFQISNGVVSHKALSSLVGDSTAEQLAVKAALDAHRIHKDNQELPEDADTAENAWKDVVWLDNADDQKKIHLHYNHAYTCNETDYNEMSMLWLNGGVKGVKVLMQRGFPHMLSWEVLLVFFCVYFCLAAYTSGVSVPAGLIVPMLLMGGSYGRAVGLLGIEVKRTMCMNAAESAMDSTVNLDDTYFWSTEYRWEGRDCQLPDPGMYAVVGMAAFLGGSGRITMMLACVIVELTDDASLIAPVGMASIVSMVVGNLFNHGLYHGLIPVFNLPFMNSEPADVMWIVSVVDIMTRDVMTVGKSVKPAFIHELVRKCDAGEITHNAFPVVDSDHGGHCRLRGIISLDSLRLAGAGGNHSAGTAINRGFSMANLAGKINLMDYADRSPITTVPHAKVARAFDVFRKLGMRHMCVTDNEGMLVGIITRKDLMTFRLADNIRLHKAEALLRGWANRWRAKKALDPTMSWTRAGRAKIAEQAANGAPVPKTPPASTETVGLLPGTTPTQ